MLESVEKPKLVFTKVNYWQFYFYKLEVILNGINNEFSGYEDIEIYEQSR